MNHFTNRINLFQICIFVSTLQSLRGQINSDVEKLQIEFFNNGGGYANKFYWFNPVYMSTHSKFMLCIDSYQKIIGTRLMEGLYTTNDGATNPPHFNVGTVDVHHTTDPTIEPIRKLVLHCPLNTIKLETLNYSNGAEFYITGSPNTECLYVLQPKNEFGKSVPKLYVTAEVCYPFINMKSNRSELELNYQNKIMSMGPNRLHWPELNNMDNGRRFVLCLDIHEKLIREQLYTHPYKTNMPNNSLPVFDDVIRSLRLLTIDNSAPLDIRVLFCPMHKIEYKYKTDHYPITPYCLAKSGNPDCVYKLATTRTFNVSNPDEVFISDVHLVGEICGIFGPIMTNNYVLERELVDIQSNQNEHLWMEIHNMHYLERMRLCKNVLKKVYGKHVVQSSLYYNKQNQAYSFMEDMKSILQLNQISNHIVKIKPNRCPMKRIYEHETFYVTESKRIGCVYKLSVLTENKKNHENTLKIDSLVCGVYPTKFLLQIATKKFRAPLL